ncbi:MAG: NADPH:quinone reductase [Cellvibrionales bacterium TMED49]|nr:MAG: NADPH:quinone reductase [Cellvibrionales bacterium TMED49]
MNRSVIITCAVTGSGDSAGKTPHLPITPKQIADASIEAAKAGAAIAHIHVRDPDTGAPARDLALYREVVDRIRSSDTDVVINLTTGMGGDLFLGPDDDPLDFDQTTDCVGQVERMEHVEELLPEICSLDCGSFNYPIDNYVYISSTNMLRIGAERLQKIGVKPELETFDLGHIWFAKQMIEEGLIDSPPLFQICLNVRWAAEALPRNFQTMLDNLPDGANWSAFALGALEMPMVAQSAMLGGHARVGLEDNLYLDRGVLATNAQLVERARNILELIGCKVQSPQEARDSFNLKRFH